MKNIPIYYHIVDDKANKHIDNLYKYKNVSSFERDILFLDKNYKFLDLDDIKNNKKGVILSFDDGYSQCYNVIYPILKKYSIPAFFFLNNDFIDNQDMFFRCKISLLIEQVQSLSNSEKTRASQELGCSSANLAKTLKSWRTEETDKLNSLAQIMNIDFQDYLVKENAYLNSEQIETMIADGYYFGGHTYRHLSLKSMSYKEQLFQLKESALDVKKKYALDYAITSIPYKDSGLKRGILADLSKSIDYTFGGYGLKEIPNFNYFRRVSNEHSDLRIDKFLLGHKLLNKVIGK